MRKWTGAALLSVATGSIALLVAAGSSKADGGAVTFDGFQWQPLGQAVLTVTANGLQVSNIGSSGADGVRQVVPPGYTPGSPNPFHRTIEGGIRDSGAPNGSFLRWQERGTLGGVPDQLITTFTATTVQGHKAVYQVDMSPLAPASLTANYYLNSTLVASETGLTAVVAGAGCDVVPSDYGTGWTWVFNQPPHDGVPVRGFEQGAVITDEMVVTAVGATVTRGDLSAVDWTAASVGSFTIDPLN